VNHIEMVRAEFQSALDDMREAMEQSLAEMQDAALEDVIAFHAKFQQPVADFPFPIEPEDADFRARLIAEEAGELVEALESGDMTKIAQESVDLIYVALGNLVVCGLRFGPLWTIIHEANMSKQWDSDGGKPIKPPGWKPPDVAGEIARQEELYG